MSRYIVGLTGGIGSGKSTISRLFVALGATVIDADQIARDLVMPGSATLQAIVDRFGPSLLTEDGSLDRPRLRQRIFSQAADKTWLEQLLHPRIRQALLQACDACPDPYVILMAPLLFENGLDVLVQRILTVDVSQETQILRTCQRDNNDRALVEAIIASQISRQQRCARSDDIIDNETSTPEQLRQRVTQLHINYLAFASQHAR